MDTSDEWISQCTGIRSRRVLQPGESIADHARVGPRRKPCNASGLDPADIGSVIVATSTPEDLFGDAANVAYRVRLQELAGSATRPQSPGFLFALVTVAQFLETGTYDAALVVGADAMSLWVDWGVPNIAFSLGMAPGPSRSAGRRRFAGFFHGVEWGRSRKISLPLQRNRLPAIGGKICYVVGPRAMPAEGRERSCLVATVPRVLREAKDAHLTVDLCGLVFTTSGERSI